MYCTITLSHSTFWDKLETEKLTSFQLTFDFFLGLKTALSKNVTAGYSSDERRHHAADATTEQYWKLLDDMQRNLVPILEPFLNRLKLNDSDDPNQKKFLSIKTQILPRLKV